MTTYIVRCQSLERAKEVMYKMFDSKVAPIVSIDNVNLIIKCVGGDKYEFTDHNENYLRGRKNFKIVGEEEFLNIIEKYKEEM